MSHDAWAAFSAIELARDCLSKPANWFSDIPEWQYQTYATRDPDSGWPQPDGAVEIAPIPSGASHLVAIEFKRTNEGLHGILTGMGQVQAYLNKGFTASALVLPAKYENLENPGHYAASVLTQTAPAAPIGIFTYESPDLSAASPFHERLRCERSLGVDLRSRPLIPKQTIGFGRQRTQWAHVREGSTVPDPLYRYLRSVYEADASGPEIEPEISADLRDAVNSISHAANPTYFLSNTSPTRGRRALADRAWRRFWFQFVLTRDVQRIWKDGGHVVLNDSPTMLRRWDGEPIVFFARTGTGKAKIVSELATGTINIDQAWQTYATNIRARAHQFREDMDSGAEAAGFVDADGRLTSLGFRFITACDRGQGANSPQPLAILRWALLTNGGFLALLHYIHSLSDQAFRDDQLRFASIQTTTSTRASAQFQSMEYRRFLLDELSSSLRVAGRSAERGGRSRPPLEGEFITMRKLGLIGGFRIGLGLEINWPAVHAALDAVNA